MKYISLVLFVTFSFFTAGCSAKQGEAKIETPKEAAEISKNSEHATFALGCFWHSEEIFSEIKGVSQALPGYSGGSTKDPSYEEVCSGNTGHAEVVDVTFDPSVISYEKLLEVFFAEHDPTTPDYAYPDRGTQYRSVIFYRNAEQKKQADDFIAKLMASKKYSNPIITQVLPMEKFYKAEDYHIKYYRRHPSGQSYIDNVTKPEVEKFRKDFPELVKK